MKKSSMRLIQILPRRWASAVSTTQVFGILMILLLNHSSAQVPEWKELLDAWKSNEQKANTFHIEYSLLEIQHDRRSPDPAAAQKPPFKNISDEMARRAIRYKCSVTASGRKVRCQKEGFFWNSNTRRFESGSEVFTWNGEDAYLHFIRQSETFANHYAELPDYYPVPMAIQFALRWDEPNWSDRVDELELTDQGDTILLSGRNGHLSGEYVVDKNSGYVIRRFTGRKNGYPKKTHYIDVEYLQDAESKLWIPHTWEAFDASPFEREYAVVEGFQHNLELEESLFEPQIPAGTLIMKTGVAPRGDR